MKKLTLLFLFSFFLISIHAQKKVAVYWDASYSMLERELDRELEFLDNYFKKNSEADVKLTVFSNDVMQESFFEVRSANWEDLEAELRQTVYDGASEYHFLFNDQADEFILFTDGNENLSKLDPPTDKPIHIVSSLIDTNTTALKLISDKSGGRFIYLPKEFESETKEKKERLLSGKEDGYITGSVKGGEGLLANVSIVNQSNQEGTATKADGSYRIKADPGDILIYSYLGKKTVSVRATEADIINITMSDVNQSLDEVILTADNPEEEIEMVNTGNTKVDERRIGYSVESIGSDDITPIQTDVQQSVQGKFTNFTLPLDTANDNLDLSQFLGRGRNMSILLNQYGLVVVDGVPQEQSDSKFGGFRSRAMSTINPDIIESITYLKGLAATNKYGTIGRNGVLLITTKMAAANNPSSTAASQQPLGTTSTYSGTATEIGQLPAEPYIEALKAAGSVNDAFAIYLDQREKYGDSPYFYIDVHDYFKGWNNALVHERILSNVYEVAGNDASVLRVVAYKQQESGNYKAAVKTLERVAKLKPNDSQTYRDLALGYVMAGAYQEALDLYQRIDQQINVGNTDFTGISRTVQNEMKNLIAQHRKALNLSAVNQRFLNPVKYRSRIVFEWNDLFTEFDLNIINPQNRFFTWSHTQAENSQRILQQHQQGYGLEEFFLTEGDLGEWKFNMKYYGKTNDEDTPTYVKITTYDNFGSPNQKRNIRVVRLDKTDIEQTVAKLLVN